MLNLTDYIEIDLLYTKTRTIVYRARRTRDGQAVIIKVLRNTHPNFNELVQFRNQYVIARHLEHPAIVRPLALERYGNGYALVMPDTGELALKDYWQQSNRSLAEFLDIAIQLAEALHYLIQERIVHKDIKPSNILIHPETGQVKLIDFSISSLLPKEQQQLTNPNVLEGTLAYISPEQTGRMNRGIDYRTDFYSLGVTFFELLTGKLPFETTEPMDLVHCHIAKMPPTLGNRGAVEVIPAVLSDIVLKLMAKNAEDRYQSALGLKYDLERCLEQWSATGEIAGFEIGTRDRSDRFLIPEILYGRETEVQILLDAFDRVANGKTEMMLVAGFSGIGKTAVISEVHKPITRQKGYFIKGKFDQFNRNVPLDAFVQAFRSLMGQLLGESNAALDRWKKKILDAVGASGQVILEVIPELERIIGEQPAVSELSGNAAQNRFNLLFGKFVRVFATQEHPLTIFLDDLQWTDSASLNLLKLLVGNSESGYLLVLGAYRDNEVFPAHPLMLALDEIEKQGAQLNTLTLAPLGQPDLNRLVADTLLCSSEVATPLSQLVVQKTQGNPFFATQFLKGLHEDACITFNAEEGYWQCDLARVRQLALTDDVVEFMLRRLRKLPEATQAVLKLAACIGNQFDLETLAIVCEDSQDNVAANLWRALQEYFVTPQSESYKFFQGKENRDNGIERISVNYRFLHDRIQQATYALIADDQKTRIHYRIGTLLFQQTPPETLEERIFEIVGQLNYGISLIAEQTERDELAGLDLIACRRARTATAYEAGREYASTGLSLLGERAWHRKYQMSLEFHELAAELASLCGDFEKMEQFVETVIAQTRDLLDRVCIYLTKIQSLMSQSKRTEALAIGQQLLQQLGVTFPESPTEKDTQEGIAEITELIGDREVEDLIRLGAMTDVEKIAIVKVANSIMSAAYACASPLYPLLVTLSVKLSIQYGNTSVSAAIYVAYSLIICNFLQDIKTGVKFARLALQILSQMDAKAVKPQVLLLIGGYITHRKFHLKESLPILQEGYSTGLEVGNLEMGGYSAEVFCLHSFWCGRPLLSLEREMRAYCDVLVQLNQLAAANWCQIYWQSTLNLLGFAEENPTILSGEVLQESEFLSEVISANDLLGLHFFYLYKLMLCYLFADIESARTQALEARQYLMTATGLISESVFYFYDSLIALAEGPPSDRGAPREEISEKLDRVEENQTQLQDRWAYYAPANHQHKVDLVEAEKCRVLEQKMEAMELYDKAIAGAKENEYIQEEALANELAAKFYLEWGKEKIAAVYMQEAYYCYARWEAKAKTEQLEAKYPQLLTPILQQQRVEFNPIDSLDTLTQTLTSAMKSSTQTGTDISDALDFASILQAAKTLSSTIELDELLAKIVQIIQTNAGAQKTFLFVPDDDEQWQLRAMAQLTNNGTVETSTRSQPLTADSPVPVRLVQYVKNMQKPVLIDEAKTEIEGVIEGYLLKYQPQSAFCLPLLERGNVARPGKDSVCVADAERQEVVALASRQKLVAILYLEHPTTKGVFTRNRQTIIEFLCAQAASALENAKLYNQAQVALTELKQAQLQLVQSEKMSALGNLIAGVAHEINNPIGFLQGNIEPARDYVEDLLGLIDLYGQKMPDPDAEIEEEIEAMDLEFIREDLPKLLESMNIGVERISNISNSLRTFSRKDRELKTEFNIHEGIDSTLLILKHRTKANQERPAIKIIKDYGNIPEVECFPGKLNQVFMNILANAIDAFDEANEGKTYSEIEANPNRITIRTAMVENWVEITIVDNGCGMKPETKERIFEQGFTTKGVGKGTGLGMAIAQNIITEKHGGTITCDSTLGLGTTFTIALPIV